MMSSEKEMNDSKSKVKNPAIWFLLALILALVLRLVSLGASSFTQSELVLVNQALMLSRGVSESSASVPVYSALTALLFFIFEVSCTLFAGNYRCIACHLTLVLERGIGGENRSDLKFWFGYRTGIFALFENS